MLQTDTLGGNHKHENMFAFKTLKVSILSALTGWMKYLQALILEGGITNN